MALTTPITRTIPVGSAGLLAADTTPPGPAGSVVDWPGNLGQWVTDLPHHLAAFARTLGGLWWPWAPLLVLAVLVGMVGVRLLLAWRWRRVTDRGYWVAITPPRQVDPARWALVWRRLDGLARRARGGRWRLVHPPLAFEVYADAGGGVRAGLWLPGWVPLSVVAGEVARAWPGATVHAADPLPLGMHRDRVAGVRLAAELSHPETGWLVDDPRPRTGARKGSGADPDLGMVFSALADPGADGARRLLLQVLVRPAPGGRVGRLAAAARHPASQRGGGVRAGADGLVWLLQTAARALLSVVELFISSGKGATGGTRTPKYTPDAFEREAMADARAKRNDRPHLLVSIRVGAASDRRGQARQAARSVADGYAEASRWLMPVRLRRAAVALGLRRARRSDWLLLSASELGVLAHLPPDPALYRFDTAALHRAAPVGAWQAAPEPGWTRHGWTDTSRATEGGPGPEESGDTP